MIKKTDSCAIIEQILLIRDADAVSKRNNKNRIPNKIDGECHWKCTRIWNRQTVEKIFIFTAVKIWTHFMGFPRQCSYWPDTPSCFYIFDIRTEHFRHILCRVTIFFSMQWHCLIGRTAHTYSTVERNKERTFAMAKFHIARMTDEPHFISPKNRKISKSNNKKYVDQM